MDDQDCQLVLIDFQEKLMPVIHEREAVLANALRLAQAADLFEIPVWATEQNPDKLGHHPQAIQQLCRRTLSKMSFSACGEGLIEVLRPALKPVSGNARSLPKHLQKVAPKAPERQSIVIAGVEAHICLMQTALELLEEEFAVFVVTDACSSRTERNRDAAFDRLAGAGAELVTTEMVLFEWLRTAEADPFHEIQTLIK